jgi:hypothetical protein
MMEAASSSETSADLNGLQAQTLRPTMRTSHVPATSPSVSSGPRRLEDRGLPTRRTERVLIMYSAREVRGGEGGGTRCRHGLSCTGGDRSGRRLAVQDALMKLGPRDGNTPTDGAAVQQRRLTRVYPQMTSWLAENPTAKL